VPSRSGETLARGFTRLGAGVAALILMLTLALGAYLNTKINPGRLEMTLIVLLGLLSAALTYHGLRLIGRGLAGG